MEYWEWDKIDIKTHKRCSCPHHVGERWLPRDENFHKDKYAPSGYYSWCTDCYNQYNNKVKTERYSKEKTIAWRKQVLAEYGGKEFSDFMKIKDPSEKDYRNFIGAYLLHTFGLDMEKEKPIDASSRPDLKNYLYKFYIETKLTDKLSKGSKLGESCEDQKDRYVDSLPSDWKVFMVSLDGSIGLTFTESIEEVKKIIKR